MMQIEITGKEYKRLLAAGATEIGSVRGQKYLVIEGVLCVETPTAQEVADDQKENI